MTTRLLEKYIKGDTTLAQRMEVLAWIESSDKNLHTYQQLHRLHDAALWQQTAETVERRSNHLLRRAAFKMLKYAAVIVSLCGINWWYWAEAEMVETQTIYVPVGQRAEITLADGTKVWLNSKTKLTYPTSFSRKKREVHLDGEAFFKVTHNKEKPFIVNTERHKINVLGTEFNVFAYHGNKHFETSLVKGSVEIHNETNGNSCMLKPMQKMKEQTGNMIVDSIRGEYFEWKEGLICFDDNTLDELFEKLQIYYNAEFVVKNKELLSERYSGKFSLHDGVEHILRTLQLRSKFEFKTRDDNDMTYEIN